jgi:hypothetical protein
VRPGVTGESVRRQARAPDFPFSFRPVLLGRGRGVFLTLLSPIKTAPPAPSGPRIDTQGGCPLCVASPAEVTTVGFRLNGPKKRRAPSFCAVLGGQKNISFLAL